MWQNYDEMDVFNSSNFFYKCFAIIIKLLKWLFLLIQ